MHSGNWAYWLISIVKSCIWGLLWILLLLWKFFSLSVLGARCRFHPSCSEYAYNALKEHGLIKGSWYTIKRISNCHPLHKEKE